MNLEKIAQIVGFTKEHFSRQFKKEKGVNFIEYVNKYRIKEAKRILENPNIKIIEIYKKIGFASQQHFTKVFSSITGFSPNAYRKSILN